MTTPGTARTIQSTKLRAQFAARLSVLYGTEVPAYNTLVDVAHQVNERVVKRGGASAERFGSIERVTAERHGAIRVGTPAEMAQVARIFGALGMYPCGFYDLRDAHPLPVPVVSTAFRPLDREELAANPFRVFTSMLVPEDRRFFDEDLERRLKELLASRAIFPEELLTLADRAREYGALDATDAERFLELATAAFALSPEPVDRVWYTELQGISSVAADIGGESSTHINHLTPRVLDIDDLYACMQARGIEMIGEIQGPPRWEGPDVLLRQTSFRALAEPRLFREADGSVGEGTLRVRFGEVEARGIALTPRGRALYEQMVVEADKRLIEAAAGTTRQEVAAQVWRERLPRTERELDQQDLAYFTYRVADEPATMTGPGARDAFRRGDLQSLADAGAVVAEPIVYEDFLPRSAAGIFASNLTGGGSIDAEEGGAERDLGWMSDAIGRHVAVPEQVYAAESTASIEQVMRTLGRGLT
jgi:uncharacterized glyoxalase superfamily metalloenzyme YdcJ